MSDLNTVIRNFWQEWSLTILEAPDSQLDQSMKLLVKKWSDPPQALQVLEVLDYCVHASLASGFMMIVFETLFADALEREGTTREEVVAKATWRGQ